MAFNPLASTKWPGRPVWLLIGVTGLAGAVAVVLGFCVYFLLIGAGLYIWAVLVIGLLAAVPAGIAVSTAGSIGWLVGRMLNRPAAGALVAALVVALAEASLLLLSLDGFSEMIISIAVGGTALAAIVFFFEVRWHRAARAVPVEA